MRHYTSFYVTGGTLRRDAPCYVLRQADGQLYDGLKQGKFCYVLTARQMGKSSLMVRTAARLREEGVGVVVLDLTAIGQNLTAEQWYDGLLVRVGDQLNLEDQLEAFWLQQRRLSPLQRWMGAIREVVLPHYPGGVVIFVDEIDTVRSLPFSTDELFAGIREFYNRRTQDPGLERLTFCLLGVATPSDLIRDTRTTPFNIGQRIELNDFTKDEATSLAPGLRRERKLGAALLERILFWTSGHPYLTQRLCQAVAEDKSVNIPTGVDRLCQELFFSLRAKERDDNLLFVRERMLRSEVELASLLSLYGQLLRNKRVRDDETNPLVSVLRLSGITRVEGDRLTVRNHIYWQVFDREWLTENMPDAELRRQRAAFRRGLLRATAVAAVIIAVMAGLVAFAIKQRNAAQEAHAEALSRELAANAMVQLPLDPEQSVLLATEAMRIAPTTQAQDALRQSVPESALQAVLRGHTDYLWSVDFSPNSKFVVTASFDHTARVWEASTGHGVAELRGHTESVRQASFSPGGNTVVTASFDKTARVWEASTGRCLVVLGGHTDVVYDAVFSPDGRLVVTASHDGTARVWEANTGRLLAILRGHTGRVFVARFSPDGKLLITAGEDGTLGIWSARTGQKVGRLRIHRNDLVAPTISFSPDGMLMVTADAGDVGKGDTGAGGETAQVWEVRTRRRLAVLRGHTGAVRHAVFSPDGHLIVTASHDGTARVWEAFSGRLVRELRGHTSIVWSAAFSPDGKLIVTASYDSTARIWEVSTGQCLKELRGHTGHMNCTANFSPDGRWILTGNADMTARVWLANRETLPTELRGHTKGLAKCTFSPNWKLIVTAGRDATARIWDVITRQELRELRGHTGEVVDVQFSPDGRHILTASLDHTARIWEVDTGRSIVELRGHLDQIWRAVFSRDGQRVITACVDGTARIWEASTGQTLTELRGHKGPLRNVALSPDDRYVVTPSYDRTARVWEARTGRCLAVLQGHRDIVWNASFSPDCQRIATGSFDSTARIWETSTGRCLQELRGHTQPVWEVAFSPDGQLLATTSFDGTARVWDARTGHCLQELRGHKSQVGAVSFSRNGQYLATASLDGTARVWETNTGQSMAIFRGHSDAVTSAIFSLDSRLVVTASSDKTARIYACEVCCPIQEVLALARTRVTRGLTSEERKLYLHEPASK